MLRMFLESIRHLVISRGMQFVYFIIPSLFWSCTVNFVIFRDEYVIIKSIAIGVKNL